MRGRAGTEGVVEMPNKGCGSKARYGESQTSLKGREQGCGRKVRIRILVLEARKAMVVGGSSVTAVHRGASTLEAQLHFGVYGAYTVPKPYAQAPRYSKRAEQACKLN